MVCPLGRVKVRRQSVTAELPVLVMVRLLVRPLFHALMLEVTRQPAGPPVGGGVVGGAVVGGAVDGGRLARGGGGGGRVLPPRGPPRAPGRGDNAGPQGPAGRPGPVLRGAGPPV